MLLLKKDRNVSPAAARPADFDCVRFEARRHYVKFLANFSFTTDLVRVVVHSEAVKSNIGRKSLDIKLCNYSLVNVKFD